jgi:hypothetical protein
MVAWDLSRPDIIAYRGAARVRAYVLAPRDHNPDGKMPSFRGKLTPRDLDDLILYLDRKSKQVATRLQ